MAKAFAAGFMTGVSEVLTPWVMQNERAKIEEKRDKALMVQQTVLQESGQKFQAGENAAGRELQTKQIGIAQGQLDLAKTGQDRDFALAEEKANLEFSKFLQDKKVTDEQLKGMGLSRELVEANITGANLGIDAATIANARAKAVYELESEVARLASIDPNDPGIEQIQLMIGRLTGKPPFEYTPATYDPATDKTTPGAFVDLFRGKLLDANRGEAVNSDPVRDRLDALRNNRP